MALATLSIDLVAQLAQFEQNMREAATQSETAAKKITATFDTVAGGLKKLAIAYFGVSSVAGLESIIEGAIEAKAKLYDLSVQTGITVEALSGLGKIAKFSNTDLTDIASASNKLAKSLFTSSEESKGAAQALAALGINFERFKKLQAQDQLVAVAEAMGKFEDGTEKSATAMLLYGKTGATLLPFLAELEERGFAVGKQTTESALQAKKYEDNLIALKASADAWKRTLAEAVLPTMIAITDKFIDLRKEGDSFNVVGAGIKVVFETIAVVGANVAFVLTQIGEGLGALEAAKQSVLAGDFRGVATIFTAYNEQAREARKALDEFENKVMGVSQKIATAGDFQRGDKDTTRIARPRLALAPAPDKATAGLADGYDAIIAKIKAKSEYDQQELDLGRQLTDAEKFRIEVYKEVEKHFDKLSIQKLLAIDQETELALAIVAQHDAWEKSVKWMKDASDANASFGESQMQLRDQMRLATQDAERQLAQYGLSAEALRKLESARERDAAAALLQKAAVAEADGFMDDVAKLYREQAAAILKTADARDQLAAIESRDRNDPLAGLQRSIKDYLLEIERAGDATYGIVSNSLHGLEDLGVSVLNGSASKDAAKRWVNGIISEAERLYVIKPLLKSIFGDSNGEGGLLSQGLALLGGLFGGNYSANGGLGYATAAGISGGRAGGGPVERGNVYRINEAGRPEVATVDGKDYLLMGKRSGTVRGGGVSAASRGGDTYITNNVAAGITRNELLSALQVSAQATEGRIYQRLRSERVM